MLSVDITHWLDERGDIPTKFGPRFRRQVLRIARLIEYGGPLRVGEARETLIECGKRPRGKECVGLMWVAKSDEKTIHAFCANPIEHNEVFITGWEDTIWADGMMEPVPPARDKVIQ